MKYVAVLLGLTLAVAFCFAGQVRVVDIPTSITEQYFPIAAKLSGYTLPVERPRVVFADPAFFEKHADPGTVVFGLYDIDADEPDVIFINPNTPAHMRSAVLVHEIVHWLQEKAGKHADTCEEAAAVEREAYIVDYMFTEKYTPYKAVLDLPELSCK